MLNPPQHYIIQGQRGFGKTTLLLRLYLEIEIDPELNNWLIPVKFNEEQYHIRSLVNLWEEVILQLSDKDTAFTELARKLESYTSGDFIEENIYNLFQTACQNSGKKIVLFWDNFGQTFQKFSRKEKQRLREVLITSNHIRIIGASAVVLEFHYDYFEPFFEFFKIINLKGLDSSETISLLKKLGEQYRYKEINDIIEKQSGRIEALRRLTSGVPRTIVLLFQIFVDDENGNAFSDLDRLLDQVTPLYKHRMDELSNQQQAIVDAVALNWDAIMVKELTARLRMESKAISAQLKLLEKNQIVIKESTSTKNFLYKINERFFNIWYLMRCGRQRGRTRVRYLTEFLNIWCSESELISRATKHLDATHNKSLPEKPAYYMTEALLGTKLPIEISHDLARDTRTYLLEKSSPFSQDVELSIIEKYNEIVSDLKRSPEDEVIKNLKSAGYFEGHIYTVIAGIEESEFHDNEKAELYYLMAVKKDEIIAMNALATLYYKDFHDYKNAEKYCLMAVDKGDVTAMYNLGLLYDEEFKDFKKAEQYYLMAVEKGKVNAMFNLGLLYQQEFKDFKKAEQYYLRAVDKGDVNAMFNLGLLYEQEFKDFKKAEQYYLMAVNNRNAYALINLTLLYLLELNDKKKALTLSRTYFEKDNGFDNSLCYAIALVWQDEVEKAYQIIENNLNNFEAIDRDKKQFIFLLISLLAKKQYYTVRKIFSTENANMTVRFKPVYYALLSLMGETDEYRKMGDELKQTVGEILEQIKYIAKTMNRTKKNLKK